MMNNVNIRYPWLSENENELVNIYEELSKEGEVTHSMVGRALKERRGKQPSDQYIGKVLKKHRDRQQENALVVEDGRELAVIQKEISDQMHNLNWQAQKRMGWMDIIETDMEASRNLLHDSEATFLEFKTHVAGLVLGKGDDKEKWETMTAIRQLLGRKSSPLNIVNIFDLTRKSVQTLDRLVNSQNEALYKLLMAQKNVINAKPDDLPIETQNELILWYMREMCADCPGNTYREQEVRRIRKKKEDERRRNKLGEDTIIDVEYGDAE